jgi:hypothetical protein
MRATSLVVLPILLFASTGGAFAARAETGAAAGGNQNQAAPAPAGEAGRKQLTGFVDDVDEDTGRIVVDGQVLVMRPSPEAFYPRKGQKVIDTFRQEH